jgi:membrane protease YdiL (CAAX protease family)
VETMAPLRAKTHQIVAWGLLAGLLCLRLPFLGGIALMAQPVWLAPVFEIGTYLLTAVLIWWEKEHLADFHIDRLALSIIILFKPIQTIMLVAFKLNDGPLAFPRLPSLFLWAISAGLLVALVLRRPRLAMFTRGSFAWFGLGLIAGLLAVLLLGYPLSFQVDRAELSGLPETLSLLPQALIIFFYQLGYAAVTEEPLFRGFLWGYLRKAGWKDLWIWLFQAGLFMLGHIYYLGRQPVSFWLVVPVGGLMLGALVWRSKTISSSLAAHAMLNALGNLTAHIFAALV